MVAFKYNEHKTRQLVLVSYQKKPKILSVPAALLEIGGEHAGLVVFSDGGKLAVIVIAGKEIEAAEALVNWKEGDGILDLTVYQEKS